MHSSPLADLLLQQLADLLPNFAAGVLTFIGILSLQHVVARLLRRVAVSPKQLVTDGVYWLVSPTFRAFSRAAVLCLLTFIGLACGRDLLPVWAHGYGPVSRQPRPLLLIELVLLADLSSYWSHRVLHRVPALWRFHAVHHSSTSVRWHSTLRMHPVNDLITYLVNIVPALALGFPAEALAPFLPLLGLYAMYCHSESNATHGVLAAVFTGPRFHRWHHTAVGEGGDRNFSGVFSFWDRLFGTYYMPLDRVPQRFGVDAAGVPQSFWAQLSYPWRRA
jgi:sterol desaturase/sphingolipid hydroxylase (fatty acid hydroxylase superfamily)